MWIASGIRVPAWVSIAGLVEVRGFRMKWDEHKLYKSRCWTFLFMFLGGEREKRKRVEGILGSVKKVRKYNIKKYEGCVV